MKILVVEDNQKFARFLVRALSEEGYVVDLVGDGEAAVQQAQSIDYDLMILDWMLPEMDGLSVCRAVRAKGLRLPILMLTARADISERITGLDAGADDYVPKPFDLGELFARMRALVRRSGQSDGVIRLGPIVVDQRNRKVTVDGRKLDFTPREYALLTYLARESGRVVPRTELLAKVWELNFDPGSNVVEVHIKNVRDKLGDHASMIETVRGVGYRMTLSS